LKFDGQAKAVGCGARSDRYIHGHAGASHQTKVDGGEGGWVSAALGCAH